ncbi:MAG: Modification methylase DpnIIA [Verrucomicrobia subdivision 3 bacterium]|nr:Modification methylase DpnIIA [Limisphaerales bacterium]MCS1412757.1 Modification methylase DpnIIA [Limisphaerales bacterium]
MKPDICNAQRLREASKTLSKATIRVGDFDKVVKPFLQDVIYCGPPTTAVSRVTWRGGFTEMDQGRLRDAMERWTDAGVKVIASNADTMLIRELYRGRGKKVCLCPA